ncbi:anion transporter [Bosea sp. (in: a-proteobacteria)]|uniref:anion transporter n=1 Tax=Bosea sp. (in: a-proteobacteria) TaxID=1871050 RepID=UPI00120CCAD3|nr:anion transporter [Bosea sp. (in: a-proteobacteria)]TAJ28397.1 MAG: anion transporter [Bosea sp. (in: a-proteobacteria)]
MSVWGSGATQLAAIAIFLATYVAIAIGRVPGLRVDRAGAALIGAALMVACGVLPLEGAYRAIDLDTIALLLGMMIVVANLRLSGFFRMVTGWAVGRAGHPALLLAAVVVTTGILSAFLVNDAICLVMTPIVITLTRALGRNPVPYLIAVALSSNVGSTATITGNPQNMIIGNLSGISYGAFTGALVPVAALGLLVTILLVLLLNPREYLTRQALPEVAVPAHYHGWLAGKSALVALAMIALFFLGQPVAKVAICAAALLLLTRRVSPKKVYAEIDGQLLLMFAGLFVVVRGLEHAVLTKEAIAQATQLDLGNVAVLTGLTAVLSNLVSNVPAVLVLKPFVETVQDPQRAWLVVAMASTLAGNFTLLGSVANLIVAERAAKDGIAIEFWAYFRIGAPLTLATLAIGVFWLR